MAISGRIRLKPFVDIFGMSRDTYTTMAAQERVPFNPNDKMGGQRTYSGEDVLAMEVFLTLSLDGRRQDDAARAVRASGCVDTFLTAIEADAPTDTLCLMIPRVRPGWVWSRLHEPCVIDVSDIAKFVKFHLGLSDIPFILYGEPQSPLGLDDMTLIPILPAFERAKARAAEAGYELSGRGVYPINSEAE